MTDVMTDAARAPSHGQSLDKQFLNEKTRMVYAAAYPGFSHVLLIVLVAWMYWEVSDRESLYIWLGISIGLSVIRTSVVFRFKKLNPVASQLHLWDSFYLGAVFLTGLTWGMAGYLLYPPDDNVYQVALGFVVGGICSSATASLAPRLPAVWLAICPALLLLAARFFLDPGEGHLQMGIMLLLYCLVLLNVGRSMHRQISEGLDLRFENLGLVRSLETTVDELEQARGEAESSSRAKTRFLASASHDLRQPIHALRLFVGALERRIEPAQTSDGIFEKINGSLDVVNGLLDSLLDISKLDAGVIQPRLEVIPLTPFLTQIANEFDAVAEDKNLQLRVFSSPAAVESDSLLLGRIVRNLVANAVRYTRDGGVLLAARRRGDYMRIEIWDTGPGIAEENQDEIFQEFFQLRSPSDDRQSGLGLGLSIVKRTCDLLGHKLELHSVYGKGARFSVTVPITRQQPVSFQGEARSDAGLDRFGSDARVLLIEDDQPSAEAMAFLLDDWGLKCELAIGVAEVPAALAKLGGKADLIISDFRLPDDMTGDIAVAQAFEILGAPVPVLIVTGDTGPDRLRALEGNSFQLLHKPVQPARLRAVIRHMLASREG